MTHESIGCARSAMEEVARRYGKPLAEIRREIELAMDAGMHSTAPAAQKRWETILSTVGRPTPEELIVYLVRELVTVPVG